MCCKSVDEDVYGNCVKEFRPQNFCIDQEIKTIDNRLNIICEFIVTRK